LDLSNTSFDTRFGLPVVKDGCGVFGMLRKSGAPRIPSTVAINGISCIKYRGSNLGAGYAAFNTEGVLDRTDSSTAARAPYRIQAFVTGDAIAEEIQATLERSVGRVDNPTIRRIENGGENLKVWEGSLTARDSNSDSLLEEVVDSVNGSLLQRDFRGRIFSYGSDTSAVYKEVGFPAGGGEDVGPWRQIRGSSDADMWIAHTRQPTNSPGSLPIWSHPFASMNTAIVHNGDISSYGSNMELLNSWGIKSHVGTDSEVIARLLDRLIQGRGAERSRRGDGADQSLRAVPLA
jgi:glutamate synthase domain-containing protein 1